MIPNWMKKAVSDQVISQAEAMELNSYLTGYHDQEREEVMLPKEMEGVAQRLQLFEMVAETMTRH